MLGVAESASLGDIERAYRQQISQYHPDKVARLGEDLRQLAERRSREINAAYDIACRLRRG
ncbi:MAG: DnaJ domain-containing protein [Rhodanobacter thiooxydans]|nr:DnaJ domain-containing protein [Rhodanobacter thiooxydans]